MQTLEFEGSLVGVIALDFCFPCQVIWFDSHESTQLSPGAIIEVFKAFDAHKATTRNTLPSLLDCPRCGSAHTERLSAFGSTACKALYRCLDCREPFEHFKPI